MKNNLFRLLKINIINSFKLKSTSKKKKILIGIAVIYIIGALLFSLGAYEYQIFETFKSVNLVSYFLLIVFSIATIFSFLFSIYSAKSGLFGNKDNDLLFSLPIKKSTVLFSRLLYLILYNFVIGLMFILPGVVIYIINTNISFGFIISIIIFMLLFSIIPTILACVFGYIVALLTSNAKRKNVFEMLFYLVFIGTYLGFYMNVNNILSFLTNNVVLMNNILKYGFLPIFLLNKTINTGNLLYLIPYIILNITVLCLFIFLLQKNYYKLISKLNSHKTTSKYDMKNLERKNIKQALRKKELKRYFSSPIYVFNTAFGVLMILIAGVASFFYDISSLFQTTSTMQLPLSLIVFAILLFLITMTNTTCSSISIEGNNFWILKTIPIDDKEIIRAKRYVNLILLIPAVLLSLILFVISGYVSVFNASLFALFAIFYSIFIANFGLIINLCFPNFTAINDTAVVKQSVSVFVSTVVPALISMVLIGVLISTSVNTRIVYIIAVVVSFILFIISNIILDTWGIKKFKKLS